MIDKLAGGGGTSNPLDNTSITEVTIPNKTTIFMVCDEKYDFALANMIIGLKRYNEDLIDKIYVMYDGIDEETRGKIQSIWQDKIIFERYSDEDFLRDIQDNEVIKNSAFTKRYSKLIYCKYYIFDILRRARTNSAVFLDVDMLCLDSLQELIKQDDVDYLGAYLFERAFTKDYLEKYRGKKVDGVQGHNGGLYCVFKRIFDKAPANLTQECFEMLIDFCAKGGKLSIDEAVIGMIATFYDFSFRDARDLGYNVIPWHDTCDAIPLKLVHTCENTKFWSNPASLHAFSEWELNHKIWIKKYGGKDTINLQNISFQKLKNKGQVWHFLNTFEVKQQIANALVLLFYNLNLRFRIEYKETMFIISCDHINFGVIFPQIFSRLIFEICPTKPMQISYKLQNLLGQYGFSITNNTLQKTYEQNQYNAFLSEVTSVLNAFCSEKILINPYNTQQVLEAKSYGNCVQNDLPKRIKDLEFKL